MHILALTLLLLNHSLASAGEGATSLRDRSSGILKCPWGQADRHICFIVQK